MLNTQQKGMSPIGILFMVCAFAFVVMVALKLIPFYLDYNTLRSIYQQQAEAANAEEMSTDAIISSISKALTLNNISEFNIRENSYFTNENGDKVVAFSYEVRKHLFANVDVVLSFSHEEEL